MMYMRIVPPVLLLAALAAVPAIGLAQDDDEGLLDEPAEPLADPGEVPPPEAIDELPEASAEDGAEDEPGTEPAAAEEPSPFSFGGHVKLQGGIFVPLVSDGFSARKHEAFIFSGSGARRMQTAQTCDPVATPNIPCYPIDHGQEGGSLSMARGTLQLEGGWQPVDALGLSATLRGVKALDLAADEWAQIPRLSDDPTERRQLAREWVLDNYYDEIDIRTLQLELKPVDAVSIRLGRQLWRDTGKYQLLDVVNPRNETWHFGALEPFEDTRVPLWMMSALIELEAIDHSLDVIWAPLLIDRGRDTVTAPLSLVGAWGIPYTDTPSPFVVGNKVFDYPGGELDDMRAGLHWKGHLGERAAYSLLYFYTHQLSPPIPTTFDERLLDAATGLYDSTQLDRLVLEFPRQHLAGASFQYAFEGPVATPTAPFGVPAGLVAKAEVLVEADRTWPVRTDSDTISGGRRPDPVVPGRWHFEPEEKPVVSYALSATRPTMIPALNSQLPFLLVGQFVHSIATGFDAEDEALLTQIPAYNEYRVRQHQFTIVGAVATIYMKGFLVPKLMGAFVAPDSGFVSLDLGVNLSKQLGFHFTATDFFGVDPYERLGLFRDRDELNASVKFQF